MRGRLVAIAALGVTLVAACAPAPTIRSHEPGQAAARVWPAPPVEARIRFVRSISSPRDLGIEPSIAKRLFDSLSGTPDEHFVRPTGVAALGDTIYVADPGAQALWILDARARRSIRVTRVGDTPLLSPVAVATRPDGSVLLADTLLKTVFLLDPEGRLVRVAAAEGLERPAGVAFDPPSGFVYVADSASHRIAVFDSQGRMVRTWGRRGIGEAELNHPTHLAWSPSGALLVTDSLNFRLQAFDANGRVLWKMGRHGDGSGDFAAPKGAAVDAQGHVFVVDALFDTVQIFDRDGSFLLAFGEQGTAAGQFWLPNGLCMDATGRIYVADSYNQRVQVFEALPAGERAK